MRTLQSVQISDSNQDDGRQVRRRSSSFLSRVSEPAISEVAMVVAILLIIIATAIPILLLAGSRTLNPLR